MEMINKSALIACAFAVCTISASAQENVRPTRQGGANREQRELRGQGGQNGQAMQREMRGQGGPGGQNGQGMRREMGQRPRRGQQMEEDSVPQVTTLTKQDGAYIINTTTIGADVRGYAGRVPLVITLKDNTVQKIEALPNRETPRFMQMVLPLLEKWNGKSVKDAQAAEVDVVTGATFTSKAIKENVRLGLEYYQKNK